MIMLPQDVLPFFKRAGWYTGRTVALPEDLVDKLPQAHPAIEILSKFGGLKVGQVGSGEQCATRDVLFGFIYEDYEDIQIWNGLLGTTLMGIAEVHHSHGELYVDTAGRCFELSMIDDTFCFEGESFGNAMQGLLLGRRARPMLRPDQETVTLYGIEYNASSPELYKYR